MVAADYIVVILYAAGLIGVGVYFATKVRNSADMFAAGGRSPWWVSGLSGFMTMFSAGTFVVWGGIAYRYGFVAVSISLCYGVAALFVGWTIAGYWRKMGVTSAAEFLQLRYGRSIVQFYTWAQGLLLIFTLGGTVYALATIVCELIDLPIGWEETFLGFLREDQSGKLSVTWTSVIVLTAVVIVTMAGGLWAVLMTDVLQFIVLTVSVVFVVPLILMKAGGVGGFIESASATSVDEQGNHLLSPIAWNYSWWFLLGWVIVHYFKIGGEWAFVQRFTCVPSSRDARKSAYIFGVMYLVSPLFWMLPAMVYRTLEPIPAGLPPALVERIPATDLAKLSDADQAALAAGQWATLPAETIEPLRQRAINSLSERAYINACQSVLPAGMIGLMVAAMISATASMATTMLNVYAAAFTTEFYQRLIDPQATESRLIAVGRALTVVLGGVTMAGALIIPAFGTYTSYIVMITTALTIPLVLPTIWGLYSRRVGMASAWTTTVGATAIVLLVKFGLQGDSAWLAGFEWAAPLCELASRNTTVTDWVVGLCVPVMMLLGFEFAARGEHPGWVRVQAHRSQYAETPEAKSSPLPARISAYTVIGIGLMMAVLAATNLSAAEYQRDAVILALFALLLWVLGGTILLLTREKKLPGRQPQPAE